MSRCEGWRALSLLVVLCGGIGGCAPLLDEIAKSEVAKDLKRVSLDGTEPISVAIADPQSAGLGKVRSLAVVDFTGANNDRLGEWLATTVAARLAAGGRFEVKDRPSVCRAMFEVAPNRGQGVTSEMAAALGKRLGADAVLVGEMVSVRASDSKTAQAAPLPGSMGTISNAMGQVQTQSAELIADYRLVETGTGKLLLTRRVTPSTTVRALNALGGVSAPPTGDQVLGRLANECAEQIALEVANPGRRLVERRFARSRGAVNRGNTFARQGAFDFAQQLYEQAIKEQPDEPAAYYNLGLLQEAAGDLANAQRNFQEAMKLKECELYIAAFQRARGASSPTVGLPAVTRSAS